MCGLIFPRQNIASALHPFQQNRPIPLFLLIVRTVFPDLPQQVSLAVSFCIRFPSHFDFKRLIKKTPAPVFLQTAGVSLRLNTNHATA